MRADGMPAELLLPWRTTAAMLGGAQYIGQMQLPGGSENRIGAAVFFRSRTDSSVIRAGEGSEEGRDAAPGDGVPLEDCEKCDRVTRSHRWSAVILLAPWH